MTFRRFLPLCVALLAGCQGSSQTEVRTTAPVGSLDQPPLADLPDVCAQAPAVPPAPVPLRRLNRTHVEASVKDVLGVTATLAVADERLFTFRSNVSSPVDGAAIQAYFDFAEGVVTKTSLAPCTAAATCKTWLLDDIGRRLFRRPIEGAQRTRYLALFDAGAAQGGTPQEGAKWVLEALLQSPAFLYLDEPVNPAGYLDGYAVASRLAMAFWGANPDAALLAEAARGALDTSDGVRARAKLMLADARSARGLEAFVNQWLDLERLRQTDARPDLVALGAPALDAMEREPSALLRLALLEGGGLPRLFTSTRTVTSAALASLYGADIVSSSGGATELNPARRSGLLTLPGVVASLAHANETSPTLRGFAVLSSVMCMPPSPPPAGVSVTLPPPTPGATTRERLEQHFSAAACNSCHKSMDGMGFAFEHYDPVGRWRDQESGKPIDDRSDFNLGSEAFSVSGAVELSQLLSSRAEVAECFARQWTRYATGIPEQAEVACFMTGLAKSAGGSGGLEEMLLALASSDYVRKGKAP